jgi:hypothetical protein
MRVVVGPLAATLLALAGLFGAIAQAGLTRHYAEAVPVQRLKISPRRMAPREGAAPAVAGWLREYE